MWWFRELSSHLEHPGFQPPIARAAILSRVSNLASRNRPRAIARFDKSALYASLDPNRVLRLITGNAQDRAQMK